MCHAGVAWPRCVACPSADGGEGVLATKHLLHDLARRGGHQEESGHDELLHGCGVLRGASARVGVPVFDTASRLEPLPRAGACRVVDSSFLADLPERQTGLPHADNPSVCQVVQGAILPRTADARLPGSPDLAC